MRSLARVFAIILAASLSLATPSHAQRSAGRAAAARRALLRNEDGWAAALVKRDTAYFRRMLADGFVYTEDDKLSTREEVLASVVSPGDTVTAAHNENMIVHLFGRGTAAVTGLLIVQGRTGGAAYTHRYRFTDTWVEQPRGRWQIVAAQDYLVPTTSP